MKKNGKLAMGRKAIVGAALAVFLCGLVAASAVPRQDEELILNKARQMHGQIFNRLNANDQGWIQAQSKSIGQGTLNETSFRASIAGRFHGQAQNADALVFHAMLLALPQMDKEITRLNRQKQEPGATSQMNEQASINLNILLDRRNKIVGTLSGLMQKLEKSEKEISQKMR